MTEVTVGDTQGLAPVETEIKLIRGVAIRFRLVDKATGQTKLGMAHYAPYDDNPFFSDDILRNQFFHRSASADEHGIYSLVVPTGTGLITVFVGDGSYLPARVRDADRAKYPLIDRRSYAAMMVHSISHGYHMLDLKIDDQPGIFDIELDPGRKVAGTLVGPDGKPATGVSAYGLMGKSTRDGHGVSIDQVAGSFSVQGLDPERDGPRSILFVQQGPRPDQPKPSSAATSRGRSRYELVRWASATGRLVDKDGKPVRDVTLRFFAKSFPSPESLTDAKGHSDSRSWREAVAPSRADRQRGTIPHRRACTRPGVRAGARDAREERVLHGGRGEDGRDHHLVDRGRPDQRAEPRARRNPGPRDRSRRRPQADR